MPPGVQFLHCIQQTQVCCSHKNFDWFHSEMSMKKETLIYLAPFLDIFQIIGLILSLLVGGVDCAHTFF